MGIVFLLFIFAIFAFIMAIRCFRNLTVIAELVDENEQTNSDRFLISLKDNILKIEKGLFKKTVILTQDVINIDFELQREYSPEEKEIIEKDKSVIGRAVVGGLLLGPVGAIVGGMSGIGTKKDYTVTKKKIDNYYLIINNTVYKIDNATKTNAETMYNRIKKLKNQA